jgi:hypothetical protein
MRTEHALGWVALERGDHTEALAMFERDLATCVALGDQWFLHVTLLGTATALTRSGQAKPASLLLGAADAVWDAIGRPEAARSVHRFSDYGATVAETKKQLGEVRVADGWARGRAMTPEQALGLVVAARSGRVRHETTLDERTALVTDREPHELRTV